MDSLETEEPTMAERVTAQLTRKYQNLLDRSTIYIKARWGFFLFSLFLYGVRVYLTQGWYIITYGLGIFLLNKFIGFLTPQMDPDEDGPVLPTDSAEGEVLIGSSSAEYRPFSRKVPEFKFWYSSTRAVFLALFMSFFRFFDVPVFWPILLLYWFMLCFLTLKKQIQHMIKYRYVPWSPGKAKYTGKEPLFTPATSKGN